MAWGSNEATVAVTEQLSVAQSVAHSFRLKVSGGALVVGAFCFCLGQVFFILHNNDYQPLGNYGPHIFITSSQLGQAVMLLALQPSDKLLGMVAAILLAALCIYMVSTFPYTTIFQLEPIEATRHWIYLALELIFGTCFGIVLIRRPGKRASNQQWLFTPRTRLMCLWWLWRVSAASFSLLEIGTTIALVVDYKALVSTTVAPEQTAEPEAQGEPLIDPSDQGAVIMSLVCNCLVILIAVLATRRRRRRVHMYLSRCGAHTRERRPDMWRARACAVSKRRAALTPSWSTDRKSVV